MPLHKPALVKQGLKKSFMKQVFIHYSVREELVGENEKSIRAVFAELAKVKPEGIRYSSYKMGTNVFIHIALFSTEAEHKAFSELPAFRAFQSSIKDRLLEKPIVNDVSEVGSYTGK